MKLTVIVIAFLSILTSCTDQPDPERSNSDKPALSFTDSIKNLVGSTPALTTKAGVGHPFDSIVFDRVVAFEFDGREQQNSRIIDQKGEFVRTIKKQKALNAEQIEKITRCFSDSSSYGSGTRPCFAPSEAFVFFNGTTPVMTVDICLDCNYLESSVTIPARNQQRLNAEGRTIPAIGFSTKGRQGVIDLSRELGFIYGNFKASE